jgi:hypothetical protein
MTLPCGTATWPMMLLFIVDGISLIFLLRFILGNDAYVWLYDPTPWYYYLAGGAIVLGIIAVCLFPLWPAEMR